MSLELSVLASGSTGNCSLIRTPSGLMLLDAGIGPRTCAKRMTGLGAAMADIKAICLTHLDVDHFTPTWINQIIADQIPVFCPHDQTSEFLTHARRLKKLDDCRSLLRPFNGEAFEPLPGVICFTLRVAHDKDGSHAYRIDCGPHRIAYVTDLGHAPDALIAFFIGSTILAVESNYDTDMQLNSPRPQHLKQRIMGGAGHLSNAQAFEFVKSIFDAVTIAAKHLPAHVVLLHRSRQCNCPEIVTRVFSADDRIRQRLTLSHPFERTDWLKPTVRSTLPGEQMRLF
jgi:phosphoribosyl 1,2-cyclic phosphodiesterase